MQTVSCLKFSIYYVVSFLAFLYFPILCVYEIVIAEKGHVVCQLADTDT
jgi:hypothetical protein